MTGSVWTSRAMVNCTCNLQPAYRLCGEAAATRSASGQAISRDLRCPRASYWIQPSSFMAQPAFQILVMWRILPSSNSIT